MTQFKNIVIFVIALKNKSSANLEIFEFFCLFVLRHPSATENLKNTPSFNTPII